MAALSIEQVLAAEAQVIRGTDGLADTLLKDLVAAQRANTKSANTKGADAKDADAKSADAKGADAKDAEVAKDANDPKFARYRMDADERNGEDLPVKEVDARKAFYRALNGLNRAALCCSGGGIRSATFCLGVIQALAAHDVGGLTPAPADGAASPKPDKTPAEMKAEGRLLGRFQYLSTVSGGGYVGSWLSSWLKRNDFHQVIENLTGRPSGPDIEPPELSWLRAYSNYLTPRLSIASADAWAAVAIFTRNLILNWLIIIPVVCCVLLSLKLVAAASVWVAHGGDDRNWLVISVLIAGIICLVVAQAYTTKHRPSRRSSGEGVDEKSFLWRDLIWAVLSAMAVTIFFSSRYFAGHLSANCTGLDAVRWFGLGAKFALPAGTAIAGLLVYSLGWLVGCPPNPEQRGSDFIRWAGSGLVYGAAVGLGAYLYARLDPYVALCAPSSSPTLSHLLLPVIFGVPWVLVSQLVAEIVFVGLVSYEVESDADREWLGRAAGWLAAAAMAWALVAFLVFAGEYAVYTAHIITAKGLAAAGGVTGIATALLGMSSSTPATATSDDQGGVKAIACNVALAVAGPIFAAALIIGLSIGLDQLLLGDWLVKQLQNPTLATCVIVAWLVIGLVVTAIIGLLASYFVNINRFSLHALYRNRLIRGYLGASRQERHPDLFTGFDSRDNISVHELWPPKSTAGVGAHSLFHVINIALNVVSTKRLAWQERKAESFTVSPRHCGSAYLGFRPSNEYGERPGRGGITLGTAVAISGAAASPNMGYHSSPSITLLLALFNVRLGWWLGNPGKHGDESYQTDGPKWAAKPLFYEAFGQTTDESRYVYLSDGGHFENLALYEMVRRRCRFVVVIDAGCDPDFAFEDLGNAVRKIYIDLGIRIQFKALEALRNHPLDGDIENIPYFAIGTIHYKEADGGEEGDNGRILYIKPAYHGSEGVGIRSYATANRKFPHEPTADQWFTESQFESYRSLGREIGDKVLGDPAAKEILESFFKVARTHAAPAG